MVSSSTYKQDLPPEGGYRKLEFGRVPAKAIWKWWGIIPAYIGITAGSLYLYKLNKKQIEAAALENDSATIAMMPLFVAEKDRLLLKNLRKIRDEENDIMKNVEGWETGSLYGEKVYKTASKDEFFVPIWNEYYGHNKQEEFNKKWYYVWNF